MMSDERGVAALGAACTDSGHAEADQINLGFEPMTPDTDAAQAPGPILVAGLSCPWLLRRVLRSIAVCEDGYRPRVIVVEPDVSACNASLDAAGEIYESLDVFSGISALEEFTEAMSRRRDEQLPKAVLSLSQDVSIAAAVHESLRSMTISQETSLGELRDAVERDRRGRDVSWWAARYRASLSGDGDPLRVMLLSSRYTTFVRHAAERLADAIGRAGHHAKVLLEHDDSCKLSSLAAVRMHRDFDPDLVVSINWPRPLLTSAWPCGVPSVCWLQDMMPHLFDQRIGKALGPLDFLAGQVHGSLARDFGYPVTNRIFAPIPACERTFAFESPVRDERFACDIAYISHQSEPVSVFLERTESASAASPDAVHAMRALAPRVLDAVSREDLDICPDLWSITESVTESVSRDGHPSRADLDRLHLGFVLPLAERAYRHTTLRWAKEIARDRGLRFRVFGHGWDRHPEFSEHASQGVAYGEDLRSAYSAAGCHLHASLQTNAHQRVFECAMAGGVMLRRGPTPDLSIVQSETARVLDAMPALLRLPNGSAVVHESANDKTPSFLHRLAACPPREVRLETEGLSASARAVIPAHYIRRRPNWVPHQDLEQFPDWGFLTAAMTRFGSKSELADCIEAALGDPVWRNRVITDQRAHTLSKNAFGPFWMRLVNGIAERLDHCAGNTEAASIAENWSATLERNLEAMRNHQPDLADRIETHARLATIRHTPTPPVNSDTATIRRALDEGKPVALHGVGDGSHLRAIIERPTGVNGRRTAVYVIEPDLDRLVGVLATLDCSELDGPLASPDVEWFVGDDWEQSVAAKFQAVPDLPIPTIAVFGDRTQRDPSQIWKSLHQRRESSWESHSEQIRLWISERDERASFKALRGEGDRPPRALVVSSRFTTVLRYSAAEIVSALRRRGWQAELLIEAQDHHRSNMLSAASAVERVKPDVVISINHHRGSLPGIPDRIPFVCWVQDDPLHLTDDRVARSTGPFDFYAGIWIHRYIQQWNYPASACIPLPRLTAMAEVPSVDPAYRSITMAYVSNAGVVPQQVLADFAERVQRDRPMSQIFLGVCQDLIDHYADGGAVNSSNEIAGMLASKAEQLGVAPPPRSILEGQAEMIQLQLNNPLYRQQGLGWAATAADELGLELAVYGAHWNQHPRFAQYARGTIDYREGLGKLMRSCALNLRLEPYPPTSHQRLLDALAAGGTVLSRSIGPWHEAEDRFVRLFLEHDVGRLATVREARDALPIDVLETLASHATSLAPHLGLASVDEVFERYIYRVQQGMLIDYQHAPLPPGYFETVFHDAESMRERIEKFAEHSELRERHRRAQGDFVRARFGYEQNLQRLMQIVAERSLASLDAQERVGV